MIEKTNDIYILDNASDQSLKGLATWKLSIILVIIGLALVFITGFLPVEVIHDLAHDTRHAMGFPCH
ncbi:MAG TPA: CbtB-domain containing protein [Spirochaetes bacterium]|nr:CbtB-domain containing protein [Spirochaetota bacterium]